MKTALNKENPMIKSGSILIIVGLVCLTLSISLLNDHLIVSSICVLVELIGVGIIVRERWLNNQVKKLIIPFVSMVVIFCMFITYFFIIKSP